MRFEILEGINSQHKLTISPSEKRVTIKIAMNSSVDEKSEIVELFTKVANKVILTQPAKTLRGRVQIGRRDLDLYVDSKKIAFKA